MLNHIYVLLEVESRTIFYVGQTHREPRIRLSEHRSGARNYAEGDELKYKYASALDALGIEWNMEIVATTDLGPTDSYDHDDIEDYYVNKYRREPLQNMRAGNSEPWCGVDYPSIEAFLAAKQRKLDANKYKAPRVKKIAEFDDEKMLYSFEKPSEKFMAPAFKKLAKKSRK